MPVALVLAVVFSLGTLVAVALQNRGDSHFAVAIAPFNGDAHVLENIRRPNVLLPLGVREHGLFPCVDLTVMGRESSPKEKLSRFYRIASPQQAFRKLTGMTDEWAQSELSELQTLRETLLKWRSAILNYWACRLTNARVEGFNNKAKLVKRRAYGDKLFSNYRLRFRNACGS